jgi:hypothetical protein
MSTISNDGQMRDAIDAMDDVQQRVLASRFVEHVLPLTKDERLARVVQVAANLENGDEQLLGAYKAAKASALEAHARCGADGEWNDQAGYFVARAAEAAVAPQVLSHGKSIAWQTALSCRMARTAQVTESNEDAHDSESAAQYRILNDFLTR